MPGEHRPRRRLRWVAGMILAASVAAAGVSVGADDTVRIGWTDWEDAEFVTRLTARIVEDRFGYPVELVHTDIAPQYQALAHGDIDFMLMAWLPDTHAEYLERVGGLVANLGVLYDRARLGWVVPSTVPADELASIADLDNDRIRERLGGRIVGIDPGAGLTRLSRRAIESYGLEGYELEVSSGSGMIEALEAAIDAGEWIVVTGWSPHWKFGAWELRYLDDPEAVLGGPERVHVLARERFHETRPEVASFLQRMWIPLDLLEASLYRARQSSHETAVTEFLRDQRSRVEYWVTGAVPAMPATE